MLEISRSVLRAIAEEAAAFPDVEVCGLLFGSAGRIDRSVSCRNVADVPADSFEIDPAALLAAYRAQRSGGPRIVGCYHSHPGGVALPSMRDAEAAAPDGWIWIIMAGRQVAAFRSVASGTLHGRFEPAPYHVPDSA